MVSFMWNAASEFSSTYEEIKKEKGEEAAHKYECSQVGAAAGMVSGAISGAAIGSAIPIPVVGTLIGFFVGGMIGIVKGLDDESRIDNVKTIAKGITSVGKISKL